MTERVCPDPDHIRRFALGELSEEESLPLESHLSACPRCLPHLRATEELTNAYLEAIRDERTESVPAGSQTVDHLVPLLKALRPGQTGNTLATEDGDATLAPDASGGFEPALPLGFLDPPAAPDEMGVLGGYRVKRMLGAGGMGIVLLADDPRLRRPLAIKVIQPHLAALPDFRDRFLHEVRAVAAIEHDNIVAVYRVDEQRGVPYLAMPLLRGETLEALLCRTKAPLSVADVLRVGRETAAGLGAAHARGIYHRDIKPGNLWLEERLEQGDTFRVKILDFGLAKQARGGSGDLTEVGTIVGTPAYMAPEQARGEEADGRADLFSLGCVLYRCATGKPPFAGRDAIATIASSAADHPPPPQGVPADLARLIMQLMAKKPEERPASAKAVAEQVEAIERRLFGPTRRRWLLAAVGLGGAAVAGGLAWWLAGGNQKKVDDRPGEVTFDLDELDRRVVLTPDTGEPIELDLATNPAAELPPGSYAVTPGRADEKRVFSPSRLIVEPGEKARVTLRLVGEIRRHEEHSRIVHAVALSPVKGSVLALSASADHSLGVWDAGTGGKTALLEGHQSPVLCLAISGDGKLAASGSGGRGARADNSLRVWDVVRRVEIEKPVAHDNWITAVALSPDGNLIAWGGRDGVASLWDRRTGKKRFDLTGHEGGVHGIAFSPDGKRVLTAGDDRLILLHDAEAKKELGRLKVHTAAIRAACFLPIGEETGVASAGDDDEIQIWDVSNKEVRVLKHGSPGSAVLCLACSPDGKRLLSGRADGTVRLLLVADWSEVYSLTGHRGAVNGVAFSADGRKALSGGADRTVRLWELPG